MTRPRVFLSYARGDDEPFVRRFYDDLVARGFAVWFDRVDLPSRQLTFHQEIKDAIRTQSDRLIHVVGPKASVSDYVREEWQFALELDRLVIPILRIGSFDLIPGGLALLHCEDFRDDARYAGALAKLVANLERPEPPLGALHAVPELPRYFLARPELLRRVRDALWVDLHKPVVVTGAESRVGVHGMGGIGKSVLAAALARDREVRRSFPDGVIWVSVGQNSNLQQLMRDVAAHLGSRELIDAVAQGQGVLKKLLAEKAVLLVLDDVWAAVDAAAFTILGPRSKALVTTRDAGILHALGGQLHSIDLLTEVEAMQLAADVVSVTRAELPLEVTSIVRECGLLPLAVTLSAGVARRRGGTWTGVLERLRHADLEKIADRNSINPNHRSIWRTMEVSWEALSEEQRERFAELAVFETNRVVPEAAVATLWEGTAGMDRWDAEQLLVELGERSLVQVARGAGKGVNISLHDLLFDFATRKTADVATLHGKLLAAYARKCGGGRWASGADDGYFFQMLRHHLVAMGRETEAKGLLLDYSWIEAKLTACGVASLIDDYEVLAPDRQSLDGVVGGALRLSSHVLVVRPEELATQLLGRMLDIDEPTIQSLLAEARADVGPAALVPVWRRLDAPNSPLRRTLETGEQTFAIALSPDGQTVLSAGFSRTIRVWDASHGRLLCKMEGDRPDRINAVVFAPDGRTAISGSANAVQIWDLEVGRLVRTLGTHDADITDIAVSRDGLTAVSTSWDETVRIWDLTSGKLRRTIDGQKRKGHQKGILAVVLVAGGDVAVTGSIDQVIRVWEVASGRLLQTLCAHQSPVRALAVTDDGSVLISGGGEYGPGSDNALRVWDLASGKVLHTLQGHADEVLSIALTGDGLSAVSASGDRTIRVWDTAGGKLVRTLNGHQSGVEGVACRADGRMIVSASTDGTVKVWDLTVTSPIEHTEDHRARLCAVALDSKGTTAFSGSWDTSAKIWNVHSQTLVASLSGHKSWVTSVALSEDGRTAVSGSEDGDVNIWDVNSMRLLRKLEGHSSNIVALTLTPDGTTLVSGCGDNKVRIWHVESGRCLRTLDAPGGHGHLIALDRGFPVRLQATMAFSSDGALAISGAMDGTLSLWDIHSSQVLRKLKRHTKPATALAFSLDKRLAVSASRDETVVIWDLTSGEILRAIDTNQGQLLSAVAIACDNRVVLSGAEHRNHLGMWDIQSGGLAAIFTGDGSFMSLRTDATGRAVVAGDSLGRLHLFELVVPDDGAALTAACARISPTWRDSDSRDWHEEFAAVRDRFQNAAVPVASGDIPRPHPSAAPERAVELNIAFQHELTAWKVLPWWKRWLTQKPEPPRGI